MDTDLETMSRKQLITEVRKLRNGIGNTATAPDTSSAGIIRPYGACYRKGRTPSSGA